MSNFKKIIVRSESPVRLDRYIRRTISSLTQGQIEKLLRQRKIKLNGLKVKSSARVVDNDEIDFYAGGIGDNQASQEKIFSSSTKSLAKKLLSEYLIYFSDEFFAINKPHGLAVQGGTKIWLSVDDALCFINRSENKEYKIVHRLDKDTSGVLLIANGHTSAAKFGAAFKDHHIQKKYVAMVSGKPDRPDGVLVNYIGKDRSGDFDIVKELESDGKRAETCYKVIFNKDGKSLIEFRPKTGRMHQLRFHSKFVGCPIIGDKKYGGEKNDRMLLHAKEIIIKKQVFEKEIKIEAPVPKEFEFNK